MSKRKDAKALAQWHDETRRWATTRGRLSSRPVPSPRDSHTALQRRARLSRPAAAHKGWWVSGAA